MRRARSIGVVIGSLMLAAVGAFAAICWSRAELTQTQASFTLLDRHGAFLAQIGAHPEAGYGYWPAPAASQRIVQALLALEDRRFWQHPGVDPIAVVRAVVQDIATGRRVSGASSIAMQVARLQRPAPRTLLNKALEAGTALCLTMRYGRTAVLHQYLRLVPFGNSSHGVAHAARFYFDKPVTDLSWAEIALLAALPQAPSRLNPLTQNGRVLAIARGERVLDYLIGEGVISGRDGALARQQLASIALPERRHRPPEAMHAILRLERMLGGADAWLLDHQEARVAATLDLGLQRAVDALAQRSITGWRVNGATQVSVAVVDRASLEMLAWVGSAGYYGGEAGAIDYGAAMRSPGSAMKPFLYGRGLDQGILRGDLPLDDAPAATSGIENADRLYLGRILPRQALANSRNVPAAALVRDIGIDDAYAYLRVLGLHDEARPARYYGLGLSIGALPTSLERLVRAYGALANDGMLTELAWYKGQDRPEPRRVLGAAAARLVTLYLADPLARLPSFPRMGPAEFDFPVALKTGTSQDYRDAWTIAYSPQYIIGVWLGRPDGGEMRGLGGMSAAARLAREVMLEVSRQSGHALDDLSFPPPEEHRAVETCGGADGVCAPIFREWVPDDSHPEAVDRILVDGRTGGIADQSTSEGDVVERPLPQAAAPAIRPPRDEAMVRLSIVAPKNAMLIVQDPDTPAETSSIALRAAVEGPFHTISWYVDGVFYRTVDTHESVRWALRPGVHHLQLALPGRSERSSVVKIKVE